MHKLSPIEKIGQVCLEEVKDLTMKEGRRNCAQTYHFYDYEEDQDETFNSLGEIGQYALQFKSEEWLEDLVTDEVVLEALKSLARDDEDGWAINVCKQYDIDFEDEHDDDDDKQGKSKVDTISMLQKRATKGDDTAAAALAALARDSQTKGTKKKGNVSVRKITPKKTKVTPKKKTPKSSQTRAKKSSSAVAKKKKKADTSSGYPFKLSNLDVTGLFDPKRNYTCGDVDIDPDRDTDIEDEASVTSEDSESEIYIYTLMRNLNVTGVFDSKVNYHTTTVDGFIQDEE